MSKNTNLSFLTDFLTADIVNSRVGMNNVSPQSTFDVTGTGKFSGILTLGSTVSNGTYTYTLPSATGTLALTSDIPSVSGYVPYTGATQSVDLGNNVLTSRGLNIDSIGGTAGALNLRQATSFSTWSGAPFTSIYATTGNRVVFSFSNDNRSFTLDGSLVSAASPRTFTFPDATGTLALTSQIPANAVGGTGTLNTIPKFTAGSTIGNSNIFDSGSIIYNTNPTAGQYAWQFGGSTVTGQSYGAQVIAGTNASDIGFKVMNAAASINYLVVRGDGLVTLTGALNGTSATFSGLVTTNDNLRALQTTTSANSQIIADSDNGSTLRAAIITFGSTATDSLLGILRASNSMLYKDGGKLAIGTRSAQDLVLSTNDTVRLTIASTGAATFSSSVTIGASTALNFGARGGISQDGSFNFNWSTNGVANAFHLQSATGNVGINMSSPNEKLHVAGAIAATGTATTSIPSSSTMDYFSGATRFISRGTNNSTRGAYRFLLESADSSSSIDALNITSGGNLRLFITPAIDTNIEWFQTPTGNLVQAKIWANGLPTLNAQVGGSGGVYLASGGTSWISASDERLKTDLIPIEDAINKVATLRSVIGRYITDEEKIRRSFLIAQDVQKVLPEAVVTNPKNGELGLSYTELIPLLVAAIQEQQQQIQELKNKLS